MAKLTTTILGLSSLLIFGSCTTKTASEDSPKQERTSIEMVTNQGTIVLELYNETPLHRDNFIKLASEGAFDSLLFHRVIRNFMIQAGDPDSRNAKDTDKLGNGGLPYKVDAEFDSMSFHKKGALGAARDGNLERASSSMQFYIVQGEVANDSSLIVAEERINGWLAEHYFKHDSANRDLVDAMQKTQEDKDWDRYRFLADSVKSMSEDYQNFEKYTISEAQREVYKSVGGAPHLDQNYTVFGEVVEGLAVVDSIAATETGMSDRPVSDVRILSVRVLN